MNTFLLLISLLLNGIAIFLIFILYARQNRLMQVEKKQETIIRELEDTMTSYLIEMKEENEKFIKKFTKQKLEKTDKIEQRELFDPSKQVDEVSDVSITSIDDRVSKTAQIHVSPNKAKAVSAYQNQTKLYDQQDDEVLSLINYTEPSAQDKNHDHKELKVDSSSQDWKQKSLLSQALLLEAEGLTEDEIARKLNKGKTEIHLLLKFNRNKEE